ncbi:MAG: HAD family hydrolase [Lachnospiraceae bacterium]|nr:HAD family hydrolase [Lachnospiraceae bacterium]
MAEELFRYTKRKDFLVCIDSDGCAMDTMNIKHFQCFGPCMTAEWKLEKWQEEILARWNEINLYTITRGINRFRGLAKALGEIQEKYCEIEDLESLKGWVKETRELSNEALESAIQKKDGICLKKALSWSRAVNHSIQELPEEEKKPFPGVKEALKKVYQKADIVIVSSANRDAVLEEWKKHDLLEYTDLVLTQDSGSKAFCLSHLAECGYPSGHVLMCGDAAGDLEASEEAGVFFYPILVGQEAESWKEFQGIGLKHFLEENYGGQYQQEMRKQFLANLGAADYGEETKSRH